MRSAGPGQSPSRSEERVSVSPLDMQAGARACARPIRTAGRAALLVSRIHAAGIDEPRLRRLAREAAATGWVIVTPEHPSHRLPDPPRSTDAIEDAAVWLAARRDLAPDGRDRSDQNQLSGRTVHRGRRTSRPARPRALRPLIQGPRRAPRVLQYFCTGQRPPARR